MKIHHQISAAKQYFLGFATSGVLLFSSLFYFNNKEKQDTQNDKDVSTVELVEAEKVDLKNFNPNDLGAEEWKSLGFSDKQVSTILKYKDVVGGNFTSKQQLKKCYAISDKKFSELEPFILLPENQENYTPKFSSNYSYQRKSTANFSLKIPGKFNPDFFTASDFVKMGFTENQANSILKYKNYLGGSFISKEKFKECFVISDENYRKMEPYLLLPEKPAANFTNTQQFSSRPEKPTIVYQNFDPNETDLQGWMKLGFSQKQAQVIINYRDKNLHGSFKSLDEIKNCFVISAEKFEEMKPYISLNAIPTKENNTKPIEESKTDFSKTDLNQITYKQLIEYGFEEKSAGSFIGFRNKLGGFITKNQILETYNIDKDLTQKLLSEAYLNNYKIVKYSLVDAPESWLKNHPYFKYYADKIIFFRISYPDENKIFKKLDLKPEAEAKMKLYLK